MQERLLGKDAPQLIAVINNLAGAIEGQGNAKEAGDLYRHALSIAEQEKEPDPYDLAMCLNNVAFSLTGQGKPQEAIPLLERVVKIREENLGTEDAEVGKGLDTLALAYRNAGKLNEARAMLKRARACLEKSLGPDHIEVATVINHLADIEFAAGNLPATQQDFLKAAQIKDRHIQHVLPSLPLAEQQAFIANHVSAETSILLSTCMQGQPLTEAYNLIFKWKGLLIESMRRESVMSRLAADAATRDLAVRLR